ncbi:MAG TPA: hypothetical protein VFK48_02585, partial [Usitatibacter sp.]|nr:hypothetical protein [Usitatibacter sp.]
MSTPHSKTLLRRTFAVLAALAASGVAPDALAGKVQLRNATGTSCDNFTNLSITPDGQITIDCTTSGTPTPTPTP